jgi:single-strand DNA-binding protein
MINNVTLMGRLTAAPELRTTSSGLSVTSFTLAIDRGYGENKQTDFINCVAWRERADFICRYFTKGSLLALTGSIQMRKYEDKNGNARTAFEILAETVSFCGDKAKADKNTAETGNGNNGQISADFGEADNDGMDLPF